MFLAHLNLLFFGLRLLHILLLVPLLISFLLFFGAFAVRVRLIIVSEVVALRVVLLDVGALQLCLLIHVLLVAALWLRGAILGLELGEPGLEALLILLAHP